MIEKLISLFFSQKFFSEEDLKEFKNLIIEKIGYKEFKPFESRINLELLKYTLSKTSNTTKREKSITIKKKISKHKCDVIEKKEKGIHSRNYIGWKVENLADRLNIKNTILISALKTRGFIVTEVDLLNKEMCEAINPYVLRRFEVLKTLSKANKKSSISGPSTKGKGIQFSNSVYDKIQLNQGIGKLIYIRKN